MFDAIVGALRNAGATDEVVAAAEFRDIVEPKRSGSLSTYFRGRPLGRGARSYASYAATAALMASGLARASIKASVIASSKPRDIRGLL